MAIYYQTPPPFTGGHQPDAGPLGPVITSATINNPPFGLVTPEYPVYFAWIPDPPSVLYPIKLAQAAQIDFAPFGRRDWRQTARVDAWIIDPPPTQAQQKLVQATAAAAAQPPFSQAWLAAVLQAWAPPAGPPPPALAHIIQAAQIDFAPFGRRDWRQTARVEAWIIDPPIIQLQPKLAQSFIPDFAPFGRRDWRQTARVEAWIPDPPIIQAQQKLVQATAAAAQPPFTQAWLAAVLQAWLIAPVPAQRAPALIQSAQIDSPLGRAPDLSAIVAAWQVAGLPQPLQSLLIQEAAAAVTALPYNRYGLIEILQAWIVAAPATQRSLSVIKAAQIDAPIGGTRDLSGVLQAWIQNAPPSAIRALLVQSVIAAATQVPYSRAALIEILQAWQAAPFSPPQPPPKIPQAATIDAPPFGLRDYVSIATNWQPIPVTPLRRVMLAASGAVILTPTAAVLTSIQFSAALAGDLKLAAMLQAVINFEAGQ